MEENGVLSTDAQELELTHSTTPHLDAALPNTALEEFEEEIELYKTYGGD